MLVNTAPGYDHDVAQQDLALPSFKFFHVMVTELYGSMPGTPFRWMTAVKAICTQPLRTFRV